MGYMGRAVWVGYMGGLYGVSLMRMRAIRLDAEPDDADS